MIRYLIREIYTRFGVSLAKTTSGKCFLRIGFAALYFIAVAFIAAFTGTYIMNNMIDKTGRKSLITFEIH